MEIYSTKGIFTDSLEKNYIVNNLKNFQDFFRLHTQEFAV